MQSAHFLCYQFLLIVSLIGLAKTDQVKVASVESLRTALSNPAVSYIYLDASLSLTARSWAAITVSRNLSIIGGCLNVRFDFDQRSDPAIVVLNGATVSLVNLTLTNFSGQRLQSSDKWPIPTVRAVSGTVKFVHCIIYTQSNEQFHAASLFQDADPRTVEDPPVKTAHTASLTLGNHQFIMATHLIDSTCKAYRGGAIAYDSRSLKAAMMDVNVSRAYISQTILMNFQVFEYMSVVIKRKLLIYSCHEVTLNTNHIARCVMIKTDGNLTFANMTIDRPKQPKTRLAWPVENGMFLSAFNTLETGIAGLVNVTVITDAKKRRLVDLLPDYPEEYRPKYIVNTVDGNSLTVPQWSLKKRDWSVARDLPVMDDSVWFFSNVTVIVVNHTDCFDDFPGVQIRNDRELRTALEDPVLKHIQITNDITFDPVNWPEESGAPGKGINIVHQVDIRACHPDGGSYIMDFGNIGQMTFVYSSVRFQGDLILTGSKPSARRAFLWPLIGALSVEDNGTIEFVDVSVNGTTPSPLHDQSDRIWEYGTTYGNGIVPTFGYFRNISYHTFYVCEYKFDKSAWLQKSQGVITDSTGYWRFEDSVLQWWPETHAGSKAGAARAASHDSIWLLSLVVPVVVGTTLLLAVLGGFVCWRRCGPGPLGSIYHKDASSSGSRLEQGLMLSTNSSSPGMKGSNQTSDGASKFHEERIEEAKRTLQSQGGPTRNDGIVLDHLLGEGSFGKVYRGYWKGTLVAVKTMVFPANMSGKEKRERMAIMEAAISSSLSHPNVVQTYTYTVKAITGELQQPLPTAVRGTTITLSHPVSSMGMEETDSNIHSWEVRLVLEYCDMGSLRDALDDKQLSKPDKQQDMLKVLDTALDIARAMVHLHSENIIHSDLKARNILLKNSSSDTRGFVAKVADFGLSLKIEPSDTHVSNIYQGTITHMAPEVLISGKISKASDVYAYGILLWELYTGGHAFKGTPRALLGHEITQLNRRPELPSDCPFDYQLLVCRCWESDASIRPSFEQILAELSRLRDRAGPTTAPATNTKIMGLDLHPQQVPANQPPATPPLSPAEETPPPQCPPHPT